MAFDYTGAKAAGYSDDEIQPFLQKEADKALAAGYSPDDVRSQFIKTGVHPDAAFNVTATPVEKVSRAAAPAAAAVSGQLGAVRDALTPDPSALMRRIKAGGQTEIPGLKTLADLQTRGPQNASDVAQAVAAAGYPRLAAPAGVIAGAPTTLSQVLTPVPGTVGAAEEMAAAVGAGGVVAEAASQIPSGALNPNLPPMEYAANVLRRRLGLGGPSSLVPVDAAQSLAEGKIGLADAARVDPALYQAELAKRGLTPEPAAAAPETLAGDIPGVNVAREIPKGGLPARADQVTPENLLEGFRPDNQPDLLSPSTLPAPAQAPAPDDYDAVQNQIDAYEDRMADSGIDPIKAHDPRLYEKMGVPLPEGVTAMHPELMSLYDKREAIGSKQLADSISEISKRLKSVGVGQDELSTVLKEYSLDPSNTDAAQQTFAATYSKQLAGMPLKERAEKLYIALGVRRGLDVHFDRSGAIVRPDKELARLSISAAQEMRSYFSGDESGAHSDESPVKASPGAAERLAGPTGDEAPAPASSQSLAAPGTGEIPPPIGEQASPESIPARSMPVKGVGPLHEIMDQGARDFGVPVEDPHLPARIVDRARSQGAMLASELQRMAGTSATPKQLAWARDAVAREIQRMRAFGLEAPESFHAAVEAADRQLLKPPASRGGQKLIEGEMLSNREIEKLTGRKAYQLTPEEYQKVAQDNPLEDHRDAVFNGMVHGREVPQHIADRYPELEQELQQHLYDRENAPLEQEKPTALSIAMKMGIDPRLYESYYKGELKSLEDSPAGRFIIRKGGQPLDNLAESAWEQGVIPEHDLNAFKDKLIEELRGSNYGSSQRGSVELGAREGGPRDPDFLSSYRARIHDNVPTRTRIGETLRKLQVEIFDKDAPISRLRDLYAGQLTQDKDLALLLARARGVGGIAEANLHVGTFKLMPDGNLVKTGEPLEAVLRSMGDAWKDVETYLVARRDLELAGRDIVGLDAEKAEKVASFLEEKHGAAKIHAIAARYVAWEDRAFLQPMLDLGIKPQAVVDAIRESGQSYIIFRRWFDDLEATGGVGGGNPLKRIKGSERDIASPFQSVIQQNLAFTRFFEHVRVGQAIYGMKDAPELKELIEEVNKAGNNTISVPIEGETKFLKVSREVKAAYDDFTPAVGKTIMNLLSLPAKMQRAGVTLDPRFSLISHPLRYQMEASMLAKHGFTPGLDYLRGLAAVIGKTQYYDEWMAGGGDQTAMTAMDAAETPRKIQDLLGNARPSEWSPLYLLQKIREIDDKGVRLGIYIKARRAGESVTEAAAQARDGVVDPAVHGAAMGAPSKLTPFFNIHLQSEARLFREIRDNPGQFSLRMAPYIAATAALWHLNKDDKEYQQKPDWEKMLFWFVPVGKDAAGRTRFLPIPKPFTIGTIFFGGTEALLNHIYKKDPQIVTHWVEQNIGELVPLPIPPFARIPVELLAGDGGYSFFEKRSIVPASAMHLLPKDRAGQYTSELGRMIGERLDVAPAKVDYTINSAGGTLARRLLEASNAYLDKPGAPKRPDSPISPFARPSVGSNSESVNRFYEYLDHMEQAHNSLNSNLRGVTIEAGPVLGIFRSANQQMTEIKRIEKMVTASKMSPEAKRALLDRYDGTITNLAATMVRTYEGLTSSGRQVR